MSTPLITTLLESSGFLQDQDWHQTAQLMNLAAKEIESLNERIAELEKHLGTLDETADSLRAPEASNQNAGRVRALSSRR